MRQKMTWYIERKRYLCHPNLTKRHKTHFGILFAIISTISILIIGIWGNSIISRIKRLQSHIDSMPKEQYEKSYEDSGFDELSELSKEDKQEMLEGLGLDGSGLDKLITATYDILGLATYFTVGKDEVRAWTFKKGMNAKQCAGIIHTDFEKGFIRAEVISYTDLIECGSELKVKEAGKARLEGKEYLMQDGDICHFRFNV